LVRKLKVKEVGRWKKLLREKDLKAYPIFEVIEGEIGSWGRRV
jgi:hypothetical protein